MADVDRDVIQTSHGDRVHRKAVLLGSDRLSLGGKAEIGPDVVVRADLAFVELGAEAMVGAGTVLRPPPRAPGEVLDDGEPFLPMRIGSFAKIGHNCVVQAILVSDNVVVGDNCVLGPRCVIHEGAVVLPDTVVPRDTAFPPFAVIGGVPARLLRLLDPR